MFNLDSYILQISNNFTDIIPKKVLLDKKETTWGNNGIGDRWCNKKYNYTTVYKTKTKLYSNNENDFIPKEILKKFLNNVENNSNGILGIYVHSKKIKKNNLTRKVRKDVLLEIYKRNCVVCTTNTDIECDHKNDLYNDENVLSLEKQNLDDFQALCRHCNLRKRQINTKEKENNKIYSAKNIQSFKILNFEFPWEKKAFDVKDNTTKEDTYWYDPVEFQRKTILYSSTILPAIKEMRRKKFSLSLRKSNL